MKFGHNYAKYGENLRLWTLGDSTNPERTVVIVSHQQKISSEFSYVLRNRPNECEATSQTSDKMLLEKS